MEKHLFDGNIGQVLSLSEIKKEKSISISQFSLKEVIRQTIFSIDDKNNNFFETL